MNQSVKESLFSEVRAKSGAKLEAAAYPAIIGGLSLDKINNGPDLNSLKGAHSYLPEQVEGDIRVNSSFKAIEPVTITLVNAKKKTSLLPFNTLLDTNSAIIDELYLASKFYFFIYISTIYTV